MGLHTAPIRPARFYFEYFLFARKRKLPPWGGIAGSAPAARLDRQRTGIPSLQRTPASESGRPLPAGQHRSLLLRHNKFLLYDRIGREGAIHLLKQLCNPLSGDSRNRHRRDR